SVLEEGKAKHIFEVGEEGSLIVKFENDKYPPFLVLKSDGATLHGTRDLAAVKYRLETWNPEKIIYVVDTAQSLHFQQLFETAKKLQWVSTEHDDQLTHVSFGRMRFEDGQMSTRKGNIVRLNEVLLEAVERAKKIVAQKSLDIPEKKHAELARIIGIGAVKYNILSQNRTTDIVFQWDKMLSLDGNSAPYLQYTHARANSILKKAATEKRTEKKKGGDKQFTLFDAIAGSESENTSEIEASKKPSEKELSHFLLKFPEVAFRAAQEYRPNIITNYLYELAKLFNTFYHEVPVLQAESESLRAYRLKLTEATKAMLKEGLELIGIEVPEEM
nr:arginine--tRNA ligase [Candidatus Gracilibacteria bacterium]